MGPALVVLMLRMHRMREVGQSLLKYLMLTCVQCLHPAVSVLTLWGIDSILLMGTARALESLHRSSATRLADRISVQLLGVQRHASNLD